MTDPNVQHTCRKCDLVFKNMSELRKHQWANHREQFNNTLETSKKRRNKPKKVTPVMSSWKREHGKFKCHTCGHVSKGHKAMMKHAWTHQNFGRKKMSATKALTVHTDTTVRALKNGSDTINVPTFKDIPVSQLLEKMLKQRDFLNDMASYIKGVLAE